MSALTSSSTAHPVPIELRDALALPRRHPTSPYEKRDAVLEGYARGLKGIEVPARMSREECAGLFGVWKQDGSLTSGESCLSSSLSTIRSPLSSCVLI